ncbi:N-formylglutamate amidohydrolase [Pararhodobacter sp. SW119]|uniref:N-formylglutamate amidohydrolase n=1 Tax=Pararhodobacter sp. SW119 TaxID=2780075 RepID=UPI001AE0D2CD|nr:N-formylglutamate amidohydrolase [Pararhodobacter sp. SW119]
MSQPDVAALTPPAPAEWPGLVERWDNRAAPASGPNAAGVVMICEHASNATAEPWGDLGLAPDIWGTHVAWDIGALGLARGLAQRLAAECGGAVLVHAPLSRLIFDLNRAPDHPNAMPARSEVYEIPGNRDVTPAERLVRTRTVCTGFHATLAAEIAALVALGRRPALIAVHSFTPVYHGLPRAVEFGVIHDDDEALTHAVIQAARGCGLETRLNEPYSAAGDVTHTIRLHAVPLRLPNTMLEIRNDLIGSAAQQSAMADRLAPVLARALKSAGGDACRAS